MTGDEAGDVEVEELIREGTAVGDRGDSDLAGESSWVLVSGGNSRRERSFSTFSSGHVSRNC